MGRQARFFFSAAVFLAAYLFSAERAAAKPEPQKHTIAVAGADRVYYLFVPEKIASPAPLVVLLHGSGRDGMSQIEAWKELAEKEGIILVAPDSANSRQWSFTADGPEFLHNLVESVRASCPVDPKRMYLFGHSAGATFALYMGTVESRYFAAVGVHAGAMKHEFHPIVERASRKLPVSIWIGTKDPYFSLELVRATRDALNERGFQAEVHEMEGHDHDFYAVAKDLTPRIWDYLRKNALAAPPEWQDSTTK